MTLILTLPVSRIVQGSLYRANDKDFDGNPLVVKSGPNIGQPTKRWYFAVAIPKAAGETHWSQTVWGKEIWGVGHAAFPAAAQRPDFSWKIEDGDSQVPNKKNRKNTDKEGFPGHWIVNLSSGFAPNCYRHDGKSWTQIVGEEFIKTGYYVQVNIDVAGNGNPNNSGVYVNPKMVAFRAYGAEITSGPDANEAGFATGGQLPAGASATPPAGAPMPAPAPRVAPQPPTVPTVPHLTILAGPAVAPPPPPTVPVHRMTALAGAYTYEQMRAANWTDEALVQHGYMLP